MSVTEDQLGDVAKTRITVRQRKKQLAFDRLDAIGSTDLSRSRLAMLAETTEFFVARWQKARNLSPLRSGNIVTDPVTALQRRKRQLELQLEIVNQELERRLNQTSFTESKPCETQ